MAWVVFYLPEIEADFLALYGKEVRIMDSNRDTAGISGPRFLNYCQQLGNYRGAVRAAAEQVAAEPEQVATTAAELMLDPDLEVSRG